MDDQRVNRTGGGLFQLSMGRWVGTLFWVCISLCAFWTLENMRAVSAGEKGNERIHLPKDDWHSSLYLAVVFGLVIMSPCLAAASLFKRPIWGAIVGLIAGVLLLLYA
jgi:hypothetical protein